MKPRPVIIVVAAMALLAACAGPPPTPNGAPPTATAAPSATNGPPTPSGAQPTPSGAMPTATDGQPTPTGAQPSPTDGSPAPTASGQAAPFVAQVERVADGLGPLTFITHAGDGSGLLFAVEQAGVIRIVEQGGAVRQEPFLDIRERIGSGGERGLLGLAFHPQYASNRRLFVNYTDPAGNTVVAEYTGSGIAADPATERRILSFEQPFANHNGGMLAFGPDGYLYISTGDGGSGGDPLRAGQDLTTLLGKMLRIDVDGGGPYAIPADNPFAGGAGGARPEIWSYGLRNPWRVSFDRQTGDMFIGDVGQGTWEEVDAEPAGEGGRNYGWNVMEGPDCFRGVPCDPNAFTLPVAWYSTQNDDHCAVTGGYVYRGTALPGLVGRYVFGDYCAGAIYGLDAATALSTGRAEIVELTRAGMSITSFGEDEAGEIYVVGHSGRVLRLTGR